MSNLVKEAMYNCKNVEFKATLHGNLELHFL